MKPKISLTKGVKWYVIITWIPLLPKLIVFVLNPTDINHMTSLIEFIITNGVIPWWINYLKFLLTIPGIIGVFISAGFIVLLKKNNLL